jgi:23S rRNA (adenine2030-N6)-methyltransferase
MLSYRHAFHAGNHADVLKHFVEVLLLEHMNLKDKPYWYIDTHAGAGMYALDEGFATKNAEYLNGIARLWSRQDIPPAMETYMGLVRALNPDNTLRLYPGSPYCADQLVPGQGKLRLFELHSSDSEILEQNFSGQGRRTQIRASDGFEGIKSILPPPPRRALTLIDPPYEDKRDYQRVVVALQEGLKRFATGCYAVWYPLLQREEVRALPEHLKKLPAKSWLHVSMQVQLPASDGFGMHGSGMFILNPPWTLATTLEQTMPWLTKVLAQDASASFHLSSQEN